MTQATTPEEKETPPTFLDLVRAYPSNLAIISKGFAQAVLTNIEMTLLIVLGVLIGLASNAWLGAAISFGIYVVFYQISQYVALLNSNFILLVRLMSEVINDRRRARAED
jgi:sensor histidine kinase YesM